MSLYPTNETLDLPNQVLQAIKGNIKQVGSSEMRAVALK